MATNRELVKQAEEKLLTTTITGKQYADRLAKGQAAAAWDAAFALLAQVQDVAVSPPPPSPPGEAFFSDPLSGPTLGPSWAQQPADDTLISFVANALQLTCTPTSSGPNASSELTSVYFPRYQDAHAERGMETWYRQELFFPAGGFFPTTGQWNELIEWHIDGHTESFGPADSCAVQVFTDYPVAYGQVGANPRLAFWAQGGNPAAKTRWESQMPPNSLQYDHWYTLLEHFIWQPDGTGLAEWWVDGALIASARTPTMYANPDGTISQQTFGLYNYRLHDPNHTSSVRFRNVAIGPTRASVGG